MKIIPLAAVPSQNFAVVLDGQACAMNLYLLGTGLAAAMYLDLFLNAAPIFTARIARAYGAEPNSSPPFMLAGRHYLGFQGDLLFLDMEANPIIPTADPEPEGLGTRWQLMYFSAADLEAAGLEA